MNLGELVSQTNLIQSKFKQIWITLRSEIKPRTWLRQPKLSRRLMKPQCSLIVKKKKKCVPVKMYLSERYLIDDDDVVLL